MGKPNVVTPDEGLIAIILGHIPLQRESAEKLALAVGRYCATTVTTYDASASIALDQFTPVELRQALEAKEGKKPVDMKSIGFGRIVREIQRRFPLSVLLVDHGSLKPVHYIKANIPEATYLLQTAIHEMMVERFPKCHHERIDHAEVDSPASDRPLKSNDPDIDSRDWQDETE